MKNKRLMLGLLCLLFAAVFIYSGLRLYDILHGYSEAGKRYDMLSGAVTSAAGNDGAVSGSDASPSPSPDGADKLPVDRPADAPVDLKIDFDELSKMSDYVIGWLYLPDSVINYPVAQYTDNEYFLDRFIDGSSQVGGTLFADYVCERHFASQNTVIYGHHMKDGSMFACLENYAGQEYYDTHKVIYLYTPERDYELQVFSAFTTTAVSYVYSVFFPSDESFEQHISALKYMSDIHTDVEVGQDDRIVTLSTCAYTSDDARYVVVAKLVPVS